MITQATLIKPGIEQERFPSGCNRSDCMGKNMSFELNGSKTEILMCPFLNDSYVLDMDEQNDTSSSTSSESDCSTSSACSDATEMLQNNDSNVLPSSSVNVPDTDLSCTSDDVQQIPKKTSWSHRVLNRMKKIVKQVFEKEKECSTNIQNFELSNEQHIKLQQLNNRPDSPSYTSAIKNNSPKTLKDAFTEHKCSSMEDVGIPPECPIHSETNLTCSIVTLTNAKSNDKVSHDNKSSDFDSISVNPQNDECDAMGTFSSRAVSHNDALFEPSLSQQSQKTIVISPAHNLNSGFLHDDDFSISYHGHFKSHSLIERPSNLPFQRLLPSQTFLSPIRPTLVLDLDETLSHSILDNSYVGPHDYSFKTVWNWEEVDVKVCFRPHVLQFLHSVSRLFEVVVFTASLPQFANPVLDKLDPQGTVFSHRLFRDSCTMFSGLFVKDLASLNRQLETVFIVDNSPFSYLWHPSRAIPIRSWYTDGDDRELLRVLSYLNQVAERFQAEELEE